MDYLCQCQHIFSFLFLEFQRLSHAPDVHCFHCLLCHRMIIIWTFLIIPVKWRSHFSQAFKTVWNNETKWLQSDGQSCEPWQENQFCWINQFQKVSSFGGEGGWWWHIGIHWGSFFTKKSHFSQHCQWQLVFPSRYDSHNFANSRWRFLTVFKHVISTRIPIFFILPFITFQNGGEKNAVFGKLVNIPVSKNFASE